MLTVTVTEANRNFSKIVRHVTNGETIQLLSRGKPIANITPTEKKSDKDLAREELFFRLENQKCMNQKRDWTRDDIHDREW